MQSFKKFIAEVKNLEELTAAEKKMIDQMYDKKGNLTPLGKKVMDHGKSESKLTPEEAELGEGYSSMVSKKTKARVQKMVAANAAALAKKGKNPDGSPKKKGKNEEVELAENEIVAQYINENNISMQELENMTEEELNELIGKAIGGLYKLGAKAAVGTGRLAKRAVVNKQGSIRGTKAARDDKAGDRAEKKAKAAERERARRDRIKAAQDRVKDAQADLQDKKNNNK